MRTPAGYIHNITKSISPICLYPVNRAQKQVMRFGPADWPGLCLSGTSGTEVITEVIKVTEDVSG